MRPIESTVPVSDYRGARQQVEGGMSLRSSRAESPWAIGITVFAAAMLIMAGGCQFFLGLAGVINDEVFARLGGYIFRFDTTVWGWIHMILGVAFIVIGWFVLRGASWAIWTAIGLAVINGLLNFMWLPSQPFWAIVLIAIDVLIIWALASTGQAVEARS